MPILKTLYESPDFPIDFEEIKLFLKIDYEDEDNLIKMAFKTAVKQCELMINQSLIEKKYTYTLYKLDKNYIELPYGPVKEFISVKIIDKNNEEKNLPEKLYFIDKISDRIVFNDVFNDFYRLDITYSALNENLTDDLKQAILLHTAKIFEDKLSYAPIPQFSINIYKNYKTKKL